MRESGAVASQFHFPEAIEQSVLVASELSRKSSWSVAPVDEALAEFGARMKRDSVRLPPAWLILENLLKPVLVYTLDIQTVGRGVAKMRSGT